MNDCEPGVLSEFASITISYEYNECQTSADCNDGNVCTTDACIAGDCQHTNNNNPCDDSRFCTATDTCTNAVCVGSGNPCTAPLICNEKYNSCVTGCESGTTCSDELFCSSGGVCLGGQCVGYGSTCSNTPESCNEPLNTCDTASLQCAGQTLETGFLRGLGVGCPKTYTFVNVAHVASPVWVRTFAQGHYGLTDGSYRVDLQGVGTVASDLNSNHAGNCLSGPSTRWFFEIAPEDWNAAVDDPVSGVGNVRFDFVALGVGCNDCFDGATVHAGVLLEATFLDAAEDCNTNGIRDSCDITLGTSTDCDANAIPDECVAPAVEPVEPTGTCSGGSANGQACDVDAECPGGGVCVLKKTRHLSFFNPSLVNNSPAPTAIRVTLIDLENPIPPNNNPVGPCCPPGNFVTFDTAANSVCAGGEYQGYRCSSGADCPGSTCPTGVGCTATGEANDCARWVGPPQRFLESNDNPGLGSYRASRLQCTPFYPSSTSTPPYADYWGSEVIHVTGAEIVPSSTYELHVCANDACTNASCPVTVTTARAGDIAPPFQGPPPLDCPNALDVTAAVNKFRNLAGAPVKAIAQVQPNFSDPNADTNAIDLVTVVDNCRGFGYTYTGPCPCPSPVTCNAKACSGKSDCKRCVGGADDGEVCTAANCNDGSCGGTGGNVYLECAKTCTAGPYAGMPCNNALNCNQCSGGTYHGLPCMPGLSPCAGGSCPLVGTYGDTRCASGPNAGAMCVWIGDCAGHECKAFSGGFCRDLCGRCTPP